MIVAIALGLAFVIVMLRSILIHNEISKMVEGNGSPLLWRLRLAFYLCLWGGSMVAIFGSFTQSNWLREIGLWLISTSALIFIARFVEMQRRQRQRRRHE